MENTKIGVYVKVNEKGEIINISSDIFLESTQGWQKIDEGTGDRYAHAKPLYFKKPLSNPADGSFNYRLVDGRVEEA